MAIHLISSGRGRGNGTARLARATVAWGLGLGSGTGPEIGSESSDRAGLAVVIGDTEENVSCVGSA